MMVYVTPCTKCELECVPNMSCLLMNTVHSDLGAGVPRAQPLACRFNTAQMRMIASPPSKHQQQKQPSLNLASYLQCCGNSCRYLQGYRVRAMMQFYRAQLLHS